MLFQQLNRTDAEKVFIIVKNTSGGTIAANCPVYFETREQSDGLCVSQMEANGNLLFAGINDASLADDGFGLVQVYGHRTSAVYGAVGSSFVLAPGSRLIGVDGAAYLTTGSCLSAGMTTEALLQSYTDNFVISMETTLNSTILTSGTGNAVVFIRAL
jgi:hypothetical protein